MAVKPMGHSRQRSVDLNGVRSAAQGQGSMSTSTQNSTVPAAEAIFDFESKEAAEKELLMLRNVAVKKDEESAKLMLEVYRHRAIRKESCKINEEIETARAEILKEQEKAQEARASAEQWKAQMEQYRHEMEHLRASADKVPGLTQELKEAKAQQAALEVEMQHWRKEAEELRSKLEAVEKEREADLQLHAQQAQRELSPSHETMAQTSLNGHTPKAKSSESFHERSAKAGRPRKNICMVPTSGSPELTPGSVTRFSDAPSSGAAPSHSKSREPESPKGRRRKPVVYAAIKKDPNAQEAVLSQVHIPGMGTAPDSGTLARLLLQRTNISMYGPEARRQQQQQQQQQYQQMGMLLPQGGMQPMAMAVPMHQMAAQAHMPDRKSVV